MSPTLRNLALCFSLFMFFFNQSYVYFLICIWILGSVVAIIENEAEFQERIKNKYLAYYYSISIAGIIGVILMGILSSFYVINIAIAGLGIIILVGEILDTCRKLWKQRKDSLSKQVTPAMPTK